MNRSIRAPETRIPRSGVGILGHLDWCKVGVFDEVWQQPFPAPALISKLLPSIVITLGSSIEVPVLLISC